MLCNSSFQFFFPEKSTSPSSSQMSSFERQLRAKERAIACIFTMRGILDRLEKDLQPTQPETCTAISGQTEKTIEALSAAFDSLVENVGTHREIKTPSLRIAQKLRRAPTQTELTAPLPPSEKKTSPLLKQPERKKPPKTAKLSRHQRRSPPSMKKTLENNTPCGANARADFEKGLVQGCLDLNIRCPRINYEHISFYLEDLHLYEQLFEPESKYWRLGYAVATFEKQQK